MMSGFCPYTMGVITATKKKMLNEKRLNNDEKWLNFAFHFSDDPE